MNHSSEATYYGDLKKWAIEGGEVQGDKARIDADAGVVAS